MWKVGGLFCIALEKTETLLRWRSGNVWVDILRGEENG